MIDLGQYDAIRSRSRLPAIPWAGVRERAALSAWIADSGDERAARFVRRCRAIRKAGRIPKIERGRA